MKLLKNEQFFYVNRNPRSSGRFCETEREIWRYFVHFIHQAAETAHI